MALLTYFYATRDDMTPALDKIEALMPINYVRAGLFLSPEVERYGSWREIPHVGLAPSGRSAGDDYFVIPALAEVVVQDVPQRRGGMRYEIDNVLNPGIMFRPGGIYGDKCLIKGEFGTARTDELSRKMSRLFHRHLVKDWPGIGVSRVGPEALCLLRASWRLTPDVTWNPITNLAESAPDETVRDE